MRSCELVMHVEVWTTAATTRAVRCHLTTVILRSQCQRAVVCLNPRTRRTGLVHHPHAWGFEYGQPELCVIVQAQVVSFRMRPSSTGLADSTGLPVPRLKVSTRLPELSSICTKCSYPCNAWFANTGIVNSFPRGPDNLYILRSLGDCVAGTCALGGPRHPVHILKF